MSKVFVFNATHCNGCYGCQIACKDEHCDNEWPPYAKSQPTTGQYWLRLTEKAHGQTPKVKLEYKPILGVQSYAKEIAEYAPEVIVTREDGLSYLDPEKAAGRKDLAEKFDGIFWNEELQLAQGCTGCAHLVDGGELPHCVDLCAVGGLRFGDEEEFAEELAAADFVEDVNGNEVKLGDTTVYYINMPHLFIAGEVWDPVKNEIIEGATITLTGEGIERTAETDGFGDFWFRRINAGQYHLHIEADGFKSVDTDVELKESLNVGDFPLEAA